MVKWLMVIFCLVVSALDAQELVLLPQYEALPGQPHDLEQVLNTQLTIPKNFAARKVVAFFYLDSTGCARNIKFDRRQGNMLEYELTRMLRLMAFRHPILGPPDTLPYHLTIDLNPAAYKKYVKQKSSFTPKKLAADSSFVIYSRADIPPRYYKNGDEGLAENLLAEMEYPPVAHQKSVQGTVILEFVVETNGYITNIKTRQPLGAGCTEEAIRLMRYTRWQPAVVNGRYVRYRMTYPITFSLRNLTRSGGISHEAIGQ